MSRPNCRRTLRLERLESREVLTAGGPSALGQYTLELLNLARTDPATMSRWVESHLNANEIATLKFYNVDLPSKLNAISSTPSQPPLAWNDLEAKAAQGQSQDMADHNFQAHTGSDGSTVDTRLDRVGYTSRTSASENAYAYATSVDDAIEAYMLDWGVSNNGHFNNIMQPGIPSQHANREVGVGIVQTDKSGIGPMVMTQDFGSRSGAKAELLGVAYDDPNHAHFYAPGEGRGNVLIEAVNEQTGRVFSVETWDQGGYQMELDPGKYLVTASVGGKIVRSQEVTISTVNVKADFNLSDPPQATDAVKSADTTTPAVPPKSENLSTPAVPPKSENLSKPAGPPRNGDTTVIVNGSPTTFDPNVVATQTSIPFETSWPQSWWTTTWNAKK